MMTLNLYLPVILGNGPSSCGNDVEFWSENCGYGKGVSLLSGHLTLPADSWTNL